jgi:transposase-like protein
MLNLQSCDAHHKVLDAIAPDTARCPRCRAWAERNEIRSRFYWVPDLYAASVIEVRAGCYICPRCPPGEQWFMVLPAEFRTARQYSLLGHQAVVDLVRQHRMSVEEAAAVGRRLLHLAKLDATTVLEWLREEGEAIDTTARLEQMVAAFSGELALDEVYDGGWYQLKATDPLNGTELAWKLERGKPTEEDVRRFLLELKAAGIDPDLVVTDGSTLYPGVLAEVWPGAKHQRCVFHFIKQVNEDLGKAFWDIYDAMPKPPKRQAGRPKKRGRPREDKRKREDRHKVRKARYVFLKREDRLSDEEREVLREAVGLCPPLGVLRRFVLQLHELFGATTQSQAQAEARRQAILGDKEINATTALSTALGRLRDADLFTRLTRYLEFENADKTSNHVERENREFRNRQNTHYRMRSARSLRSLLDLLSARHSVPSAPRRLRPKAPAARQERQAA